MAKSTPAGAVNSDLRISLVVGLLSHSVPLFFHYTLYSIFISFTRRRLCYNEGKGFIEVGYRDGV